jgi:hypothetical protein
VTERRFAAYCSRSNALVRSAAFAFLAGLLHHPTVGARTNASDDYGTEYVDHGER